MKTIPLRLFTGLALLISPPLFAKETSEPSSTLPVETPKSLGDLRATQDRILKSLPAARAATVVLEGRTGSGSGVLVSADGLIMTAAHVAAKPGRKFEVILADGRRVKAEALGLSEFSDAGLARILTKGEYPFVPVESARSCEVGEWCFALGHPSGYDEARGVVLRLGRVISRSGATVRTDCELLPGDSGGPLFSLDGKVIAIHSAISGRLDDNYHVDCQTFIRNWERFKEKKVYRQEPDKTKGFLGVAVDDRPDGVVIMSVEKDSAASKAGLRSGDVLLSINAETLNDKEAFFIAVRSHKPGDELALKVRRLTQVLDLKATLGSWPE